MAYQPYDARCKFCGQSRIVYPGCCASARSLDEHTLSRYGLSIYPSMEAVLDLLRKASDSPTLMEIEAYRKRIERYEDQQKMLEEARAISLTCDYCGENEMCHQQLRCKCCGAPATEGWKARRTQKHIMMIRGSLGWIES